MRITINAKGLSCCGKTHTLRILQKVLEQEGFSCIFNPLTYKGTGLPEEELLCTKSERAKS
jgi:esterase/lipase